MIVKNESHIIRETLDSIYKYIDYYIIIDTGSTDNTKEVIYNFFKDKNILGEIHDVPWQNFGYNRSEAIKYCKGKSKYIWVIDADDLIIGDLVLPKKLESRAYNLLYGNSFTYWRTQIFNITDYDWKYVGVLHEYPACEPDNGEISDIHGDYYMDSRRLGDRNKDDNKYERDCNLLINGLEEEPDNERYMFYLAQSYMDVGKHDKAEEFYLKRADKGRWYEEHFYSLYKAGLCKMYQNKPWNECLKCFLDAYNVNKCRIEPIYEIVKYYRKDNNFNEGYKYGSYIKNIDSYNWWYKQNKDQKLFIHNDIYDYKFFDEMSICAYYTGKIYESFKFSCYALKCPYIQQSYRRRLEENKSFCVNMNHHIPIQIKNMYETVLGDNINKIKSLLNRDNINKNGEITFTMTTCKRLDLFTKTINSVINTFTDLDKIYKWIVVDDNSSEEDRRTMKEQYPFITFFFKDVCDKGHVNSMNIIINNLDTKYWFHMEDDWTFIEKNNYFEQLEKILDSDKNIKQVAINRNYAEEYKNDDINILGGHYIINHKHNYVVHEHYPQGSKEYSIFLEKNKGLTCGYWPHYTLRPSLSITADIKSIGYYNDEAGHFEMEFSYRYNDKGFKTAFMNGIYCLHTGRLTKERDDKTKPNAYILNNEEQFQKSKNIDTATIDSITKNDNTTDDNNPYDNFYNEHKLDLDIILHNTDFSLEIVKQIYIKNDNDVISTVLDISEIINENNQETEEIPELDNEEINDNSHINSDTNKDIAYNKDILNSINFIDLGENYKRYAKCSYKTVLQILDKFANNDTIFIDFGFGTGISSLYGSKYFNHVYAIDENNKNIFGLVSNMNQNKINNISVFNYQICHSEYFCDKIIDKVTNRYDNKNVVIENNMVINKTVMEFMTENHLFRHNIGLIHIDVGGIEELMLINMSDYYRLFKNVPLWISFYGNHFKNNNSLITISKLLCQNYKYIYTHNGLNIRENLVEYIKCNPLVELLAYN